MRSGIFRRNQPSLFIRSTFITKFSLFQPSPTTLVNKKSTTQKTTTTMSAAGKTVTTVNAWACKAVNAPLEPWTYEQEAELQPKQIEIEVESCGVCHSDLSMIDGTFPWHSFEAMGPLVCGHEVVGKVTATGSQVSSKLLGTRVGLGWQNGGFCQACLQCKRGDVNMCKDASMTIVGGNHGGFATHVRAEAQAVVAIPENMNPTKAGPLMCGGVTVWTPLREFSTSRSTIGVVGLGGLGHLAVMMAKAQGSEVVAFSSTPAKAEQARKWGASKVIDSTKPEEIKKANCDLIIVTVSANLNWNAYIEALAPRGRLHFVGILSEKIPLSMLSLLGGTKSISASPCGSNLALEEMLQFCARNKIEAECEIFPIEKINDCLAKVKDGSIRYRGVVVVKN